MSDNICWGILKFANFFGIIDFANLQFEKHVGFANPIVTNMIHLDENMNNLVEEHDSSGLKT